MGSITHLISVLLLLLWSAENAAADSILGDIASAARKFTGGLTPVVELDYGKFQGVGDDITGTDNYLGKTVPSPGQTTAVIVSMLLMARCIVE